MSFFITKRYKIKRTLIDLRALINKLERCKKWYEEHPELCTPDKVNHSITDDQETLETMYKFLKEV